MARIAPGATYFSSLDEALASANLDGIPPLRDVVISSDPVGGDLAAEVGDFWFHSDGCFIDRPPRWVAIVIIEAERGGELSVLNSEAVLDAWSAAGPPPSIPVRFGAKRQYVKASVWDETERIFRFRRDFMLDLPDMPGARVAAIDAVARASQRALNVEIAREGEVLLLDNWRTLHRRCAFEGRRVIRRLWYP